MHRLAIVPEIEHKLHPHPILPITLDIQDYSEKQIQQQCTPAWTGSCWKPGPNSEQEEAKDAASFGYLCAAPLLA